MAYNEPPFTIGIEEEYLLVDRQSRDLVPDPSASMMRECEQALGDLVRPEFMKSQIEVGTRVCQSVTEARADLARLRTAVAVVAERYGYAPIAASTHPFAHWQTQQHTDKERYNALARDMQALARRLLICGMHVHVGIDNDEMRIDLMNQATYFLPHLLALSTSSPFWGGEDTGLQSYRLCVFDELPRSGLPAQFESFQEYRRHVDILVHAGLIPDATMLWWDIRPSDKFPTLEMRITDICTRLDDAICIAALFVSILRMLYRLRRENQRWRIYAPMLIRENRWRAQRYGFDEGLVDFGKGEVVPYAELMSELLHYVAEDAAALGCADDVAHAQVILKEGTSAHRQRRVFNGARAEGASAEEAMRRVVDTLIAETVVGTEAQPATA